MNQVLSTGFERRVRVRGYEMNASGFVPLSHIARYGEHVRWDGLRDRELGLHKHWQRGVLRAQRMQLFANIHFDVELRISLWVSRVGRTSFELAHRMERASDGSLVALAAATIVNLGADRRPAPVGPEMAALVSPGPLPEAADLSAPAPETMFRHRFVARPSDQDVLQHVNHARYIDYIEDARWFGARSPLFASDPLAAQPSARQLTIAYEREAVAGDELEAVMWPSVPTGYRFEIRRPADGVVLTRAHVRTG